MEESREIDDKLRQAWIQNHQHCLQINNKDCTSFDEKIDKTKQAVLEIMGKSTDTHFLDKFPLNNMSMKNGRQDFFWDPAKTKGKENLTPVVENGGSGAFSGGFNPNV